MTETCVASVFWARGQPGSLASMLGVDDILPIFSLHFASPHERLPLALLNHVSREPLEEPGILSLVDGPEDRGRRPSARVDHRAVGDATADVLAAEAIDGHTSLRRVHDDGVGHEDDGEVEAEDAVLAGGRGGVRQAGQEHGLIPHALVAHEVRVHGVVRLELAVRDLPDVRPEE